MNKLLDESLLNPAEYEEVVFHDPDSDPDSDPDHDHDIVPDHDSNLIEPEQIQSEEGP